MEKTQYQYKVVIGMDAQDLKNSVELRMSRGWVCTGGIFANGSSYLMQAMTLRYRATSDDFHEDWQNSPHNQDNY